MFWHTSWNGIANDRWPLVMNGTWAAFNPRFTGNTSAGAMTSSTMYLDYTNQNVGIGTITPNATTRLDVNGLVRIAGGNPGNGKVLVSDATGIASWQNLSGASGALANWSIAGNSGMLATTNFIGTTDVNPLVFRTNNVERMRVDATGNLGLGVTNPTVKLDVAGLIRSTNNGSAYFQ